MLKLNAWPRVVSSVLDTMRAVYGGAGICESVEIEENI